MQQLTIYETNKPAKLEEVKSTHQENHQSQPEKLSLRPYQKKAIGECYKKIREGFRKPLIYAPTGAGKSLLSSHIIKDASSRNKRVLFLVHRDPLVQQTVKTLVGYGLHEDKIGFIKAGYPHASDEDDVIVASIQSLARRDFPNDIGLIVVDEAHTTAFYSTYSKVQDYYAHDGRTGAIVIGLSASPWRTKPGEAMKTYFDAIVIAASMTDLIKDGYLAQPRYFGFGGLIDLSEFEIGYDGDYKGAEVKAACMADGFNERIIEEYKELCPERTGIAFCASVKQSEYLSKLFNDAGLTAEHIDANTPSTERQNMYARLASGQTRVLCSVGTLTEGFDVKSIGAVILARPTRSNALYTQMCGRGLRSFPGKKDCFILDFGENIKRLGFLSEQPEPTLEPIKEKKEPKKKECPNCHNMIASLLKICPHCGHEFDDEGGDKWDEETFDTSFDGEFGELFDRETWEKVKYFRSQLKTRYKKGQSRDRAWQLYIDKYNETPDNRWAFGAVFGKVRTEFNQQKFLEYLHSVSPRQPAPDSWVKHHLRLEFGKDPIKHIDLKEGMKWYQILQVNPDSDWQEVKINYRKLSKDYHPDCGGDTAKMQLINWAFDKAKKWIKK